MAAKPSARPGQALATRSRASRKGWEARRLMKRARDDALAAALAGGPPLEARRGGAKLSPDDSNPGVLMRRAIDSLKARDEADG
jgi:hypothetical protein